jgi:hypothetical protein
MISRHSTFFLGGWPQHKVGQGAHRLHLRLLRGPAHIPLPEWRCVNVFWCLLDAMTLLRSERVDARFGKTLAALSEATGALQVAVEAIADRCDPVGAYLQAATYICPQTWPLSGQHL